MDKLRIRGGRALSGTVRISGAKNAALPALAASLLTEEEILLHNVPDVRDVGTMLKVLRHLGAERAERDGTSCRTGVARLSDPEAPYEMVKTMRASVLTLGPLVARLGRARVSLPGGCAIGERPIDMHISVLRRLGADVEIRHGYVDARADRLRGTEFSFEQKTVTGTENALMAASLAEGTTRLANCAEEPEVADLAALLSKMGARIEGAGTDTITVEGVEALGGAEHRVIPDRIEAGTFVMAGVLAGEEVVVDGCDPSHLTAALERLREAGARIESEGNRITVRSASLRGTDAHTSPYPGFPTDLQAQYMAAMTGAEGASVITEAIFENRFMHVGELRRMGAGISLDGRQAVVKGPTALSGAQVMATDLRASACLVLAGLAAEGTTVVDRVYHLDRGYERIEEKLAGLGADIERIS